MKAPHYAELFVNTPCELGEGPFWHADRLWWVDIDRGLLHSCDSTGTDQYTSVFREKLGAAAPTSKGRFIVALERHISFYDPISGKLEEIGRHDTFHPGSRFNDGKCDPVGRFVVGTLCSNESDPLCALYSCEKGQPLKKIHSDVFLSNGLAWSHDGCTVYYIDSLRYQVTAHDYDIGSGRVGNPRVVATISRDEGIPDGMTIDTSGCLWIALWGGGKVIGHDPSSGLRAGEISLPCSHVTSCCFGGADYRDLYITTARADLTREQLDREPLAGSVFRYSMGVPGEPVTLYCE